MDTKNPARKGSDQILDHYCCTCHENGTHIEALSYCQQCTKLYCDECGKLHELLYKKHDVVGRDRKEKWPVNQAIIEILERCKQHEGRKIELFCDDHSQLCCYQCQFESHRTCSKIELISEKAKGFHQAADFQNLPSYVTDQQEMFDRLIHELNDDIQLLTTSHIKCLEDIKSVRNKINAYFDELERKAIEDLENCLVDAQKDVQFDIDQCTKLQRNLYTIADSLSTIAKDNESLSFLLHKKCQKLSQPYKEFKRKDSLIAFRCNPSIEKFVSSLQDLRKIICESIPSKNKEVEPNEKVAVTGDFTSPSIKLADDFHKCYRTGVHEFPDGTVVLSDKYNKRVKLLDTDYKVIDHLQFVGHLWDLCGVSAYEIAVISDGVVHEVFLCSVADGHMQRVKTHTFQHRCIGIAFGTKSGNLYITSGTTLYQYTLDGQLVKEFFSNKSCNSVHKCAISPDETKIYVIGNQQRSELITLSQDGIRLSTIVLPEQLTDVRVTDKGQLLVCSYSGHSVYQVD